MEVKFGIRSQLTFRALCNRFFDTAIGLVRYAGTLVLVMALLAFVSRYVMQWNPPVINFWSVGVTFTCLVAYLSLAATIEVAYTPQVSFTQDHVTIFRSTVMILDKSSVGRVKVEFNKVFRTYRVAVLDAAEGSKELHAFWVDANNHSRAELTKLAQLGYSVSLGQVCLSREEKVR